jgi:hypothetical protein
LDDNKASAAIAAVLGEAVLGRGGGVGVGELRMECSGILLLLLLYLVGIGIIAECRKVASTRGWNCHLNEHFCVVYYPQQNRKQSFVVRTSVLLRVLLLFVVDRCGGERRDFAFVPTSPSFKESTFIFYWCMKFTSIYYGTNHDISLK